MSNEAFYSIGTPGTPWTEQEKQQWYAQQQIKRSYQEEVLDSFDQLPAQFEWVQYGALPYDEARYPVFIARPVAWQDDKPTILVTGGVHGYETSGVQGALAFLYHHGASYLAHFNVMVAPCLSPWGFETINRWNPLAVDPNRSFKENSGSPEAHLIMQYVNSLNLNLLAHFDLHETTDTDNSEFRPALAARDGIFQDNWNIPDGFYTVGDSQNPQSDFQAAIIASVEQVTHIAPADEQGKIIGADLQQKGVIHYDKKKLFLCGGFTNAQYVTTTEVYPDSPRTNPQNCIEAQVAAVTGGLDFLLKQV